MASVCVCVCPFTAGITGQDCKWSEAGRQLVEWLASVAAGYKVSFQKAYPGPPWYPTSTSLTPALLCVSVCFKSSQKMHSRKKRRAGNHSNQRCHVHNFEMNTNTHDSPGRERITSPVALGSSTASVSLGKANPPPPPATVTNPPQKTLASDQMWWRNHISTPIGAFVSRPWTCFKRRVNSRDWFWNARAFLNNQIMVYLRPVPMRVNGEMPVKSRVALSYGMVGHF